MGQNDLGLLHTENSLNVLQTFSSATVIVIHRRMGMWGEAMFGSEKILGAAYQNTYNKGDSNILCSRDSLNVSES